MDARNDVLQTGTSNLISDQRGRSKRDDGSADRPPQEKPNQQDTPNVVQVGRPR